jgi:hypothetical protein
MTILALLASVGAFISWLLLRPGGIYNKQEPMKTPPTTAKVPPVPNSTITVSTPLQSPPSEPGLMWDTPQQAFHSVRVICDEMGLNLEQKNEICYTINGESEFHIKAVGKPNKNGTRDWGICQFNDGAIKGIQIWIGKGATFKDTDEVLNNPEKCVRTMINTYKAGHIGWWYGHAGYSLVAVDNSPMWKLKVI